jgi:hypothetical protein
MFDTLRYTKRLEEVGFEKKQAEESIKVLAEIMETNLATKIDFVKLENQIQSLEYRLGGEIKELGLNMANLAKATDTKIENLGKATDAKIEKVQSDLIIKLGAMLFVTIGLSTGILGALIKL